MSGDDRPGSIEPVAAVPVDDVAAGLSELVGVLIRLRPRDISLTAEGVLVVLERSGPCRLASLVASAGVAQPTMTELVTRLAGAGLVTRSRDPGDGRAVLVGITPAGRAMMEARADITRCRLVSLLADLRPAELAALVAAMPAIGHLHELESRRAGPSDSEA
jgi:DNA-binding MarR family transcriptional regulator